MVSLGHNVLNYWWTKHMKLPDRKHGKVHVAQMGTTWGRHVGPMNLAIKLGPQYTSANAGGRGQDTANAVLQGPHFANGE